MSYVDETYYKDKFKGTIIPESEREQKFMLASLDIDSLTYNRIVAKQFDNLTKFQQEIIKTAVCLHAEFLYQYGDMLETPLSGYTAGSTSVSFDNNRVVTQNGTATSLRAFNVLKQCGLTVRLFI